MYWGHILTSDMSNRLTNNKFVVTQIGKLINTYNFAL